jgi:hypothetical protein
LVVAARDGIRVVGLPDLRLVEHIERDWSSAYAFAISGEMVAAVVTASGSQDLVRVDGGVVHSYVATSLMSSAASRVVATRGAFGLYLGTDHEIWALLGDRWRPVYSSGSGRGRGHVGVSGWTWLGSLPYELVVVDPLTDTGSTLRVVVGGGRLTGLIDQRVAGIQNGFVAFTADGRFVRNRPSGFDVRPIPGFGWEPISAAAPRPNGFLAVSDSGGIAVDYDFDAGECVVRLRQERTDQVLCAQDSCYVFGLDSGGVAITERIDFDPRGGCH